MTDWVMRWAIFILLLSKKKLNFKRFMNSLLTYTCWCCNPKIKTCHSVNRHVLFLFTFFVALRDLWTIYFVYVLCCFCCCYYCDQNEKLRQKTIKYVFPHIKHAKIRSSIHLKSNKQFIWICVVSLSSLFNAEKTDI